MRTCDTSNSTPACPSSVFHHHHHHHHHHQPVLKKKTIIATATTTINITISSNDSREDGSSAGDTSTPSTPSKRKDRNRAEPVMKQRRGAGVGVEQKGIPRSKIRLGGMTDVTNDDVDCVPSKKRSRSERLWEGRDFFQHCQLACRRVLSSATAATTLRSDKSRGGAAAAAVPVPALLVAGSFVLLLVGSLVLHSRLPEVQSGLAPFLNLPNDAAAAVSVAAASIAPSLGTADTVMENTDDDTGLMTSDSRRSLLLRAALSTIMPVVKAQPRRRPPDHSSRTATVIGIASGYDLVTYRRFVGSLRYTGFVGNIILGIAADTPTDVVDYLEHEGVTCKFLDATECTYPSFSTDGERFLSQPCWQPYTDLKFRWAKYPLCRDWLLECEDCTGPVLFTDVRDVFFQDMPFANSDEEPLKGGDNKQQQNRQIQLFLEAEGTTTADWVVDEQVEMCKKKRLNGKPMLCSGTTISTTREAMVQFLEIMTEEIYEWNTHPDCRFNIEGGDQVILNHLYWATDRLHHLATPIANQRGVVNTVGAYGASIRDQHIKSWQRWGWSRRKALHQTFAGQTETNWLGKWRDTFVDLIDDEGYFLNLDGSRSKVVHQYDRFGPSVERWLDNRDFLSNIEVLASRRELPQSQRPS